MSSLAEDQAHLLHALARHGVEFVVTGGVAAQLSGWNAAADILRSKSAVRRSLAGAAASRREACSMLPSRPCPEPCPRLGSSSPTQPHSTQRG
jgi:hypothetical protein